VKIGFICEGDWKAARSTCTRQRRQRRKRRQLLLTVIDGSGRQVGEELRGGLLMHE